MSEPFDNIEHALKRAVFWIEVLVEYGDVEPDDTDVRIKFSKNGGADTVLDKSINLGADLRAFADQFGVKPVGLTSE